MTVEDIRGGDFAVVVIDDSYRGGITEEIPSDLHVYDAPDPEGPFGGVTHVLAACGDITVG